MLKTLGKTTWDKLEVGEVFVWHWCWTIYQKLDASSARLLATDIDKEYCDQQDADWKPYNDVGFICNVLPKHKLDKKHIYKLPLAVQRLWKEE